MQTGVAKIAAMTPAGLTTIPPYVLLHMLTPAPPSGWQSASDLHAKPVVPSNPVDVETAASPLGVVVDAASSNRWKDPESGVLVHTSPTGQVPLGVLLLLEQLDASATQPAATRTAEILFNMSNSSIPNRTDATKRFERSLGKRCAGQAKPWTPQTLRPSKCPVNVQTAGQ
jgi:hypothetical protein